jgi:hypothetical protein
MKKELETAYENFKVLTPGKVKEEIIFESEFFTVARVTIELPPPEGFATPKMLVAEGVSKRSGEFFVDKVNEDLRKEISLGRARKAMALKLVSKKPWVKIHNNLMG